MAVFGDTLRQARAYKGVTLKEAEQATRINRHHLAALEDENFGVLPPLIYQRGIVRNYAAYLDLDPGKLLSMFEEARGGDSTAELVAAVKPLDMPSHWAPNFAIIAFLVVMSAIVFAWVYSASFAQNEAPATMASSRPMPTVTPVPSDQLVADLPSPTARPTTAPAPRQSATVATAPEPTARVVNAAPPAATSTPNPTPRATAETRPTITPTATVTPFPPTAEPPTPAPVVAEALPTEIVAVEEVPAEVEAQNAPSAGDLTILLTATSPLDYVSVTVDGVVLFEGSLQAGQSTEWLSGQRFEVYTTNVSATQVTRQDTGSSFVMGYDEAPGGFPLLAGQ